MFLKPGQNVVLKTAYRGSNGVIYWYGCVEEVLTAGLFSLSLTTEQCGLGGKYFTDVDFGQGEIWMLLETPKDVVGGKDFGVIGTHHGVLALV